MATAAELIDEPFDYERELHDMVNEEAPRVFAVVAEETLEGGGRDATVVAWGMLYPEGRVHVMSGGDGRGNRIMRLRSAERAVWHFERVTGGDVRLVWAGAAKLGA